MSPLSMDRAAREAFLADVHVGVLAVEREDGPPLVAPLWYRYTPGGDVEFTTESSARKVALLRKAGRATLCVQREAMPPAYVTVEGTVTIEPVTDEARLAIATRYLGEEAARGYVEAVSTDDLLVRLQPVVWRTVDFAKLDLPSS